MANTEKKVAVVVLAAGSSTRMGQPKQLLEVEGETLIRRTVKTALASKATLVIVALDPSVRELRQEISDLRHEEAPIENPQLGQSESIRAGLEKADLWGCDAVLFTPCDLPLLRHQHLDALISKYQNDDWLIVASRYSEVLGTPMLLDETLWNELREMRGDVGARKILPRHTARTTFVDWQGGQFDLDTPQDYENFRQSSRLPEF